MNAFEYYMPPRIHYGSGNLEKLGDIAKRYGNLALVIGPVMNEFIRPIYDRAEKILKEAQIEFITFYEVEPNPSTETVLRAKYKAEEKQVDMIISIGGGSSIDTGKMVASLYGNPHVQFSKLFMTNDHPFGVYDPIGPNPKPLIAISTTSGTGSQCTQAAVITDALSHQKLTVFHQDHFPKEVIVDPQLMMSLPAGLTASTAFDAFTHAFESYLNTRLAPHSMMTCELAISTILSTLPKVLKENKLEYREALAYADTLAGQCLANGGAHLPHPMSEIIGSTLTRLNHGQALALVYPAFIDYSWKSQPEKVAFVARVLEPKLKSSSDSEAAMACGKLLEHYLKEVGLEINLKANGLDDAKKQEILECPIWKHLPMAPTQDILTIVKSILNKETL
jgi:alcohol dehydrogenase class IV